MEYKKSEGMCGADTGVYEAVKSKSRIKWLNKL
jgi:hypothetical protein